MAEDVKPAGQPDEPLISDPRLTAQGAISDEALRKADVALYRAKAERRSALRFFEPAMDTRVQERASMERALREAMDAGRISTLYQPNVSLRTHKIIGFEAVPHMMAREFRHSL